MDPDLRRDDDESVVGSPLARGVPVKPAGCRYYWIPTTYHDSEPCLRGARSSG